VTDVPEADGGDAAAVQLRRFLEVGRAAWPGLISDEARLAAYLHGRRDLLLTVSDDRISDLYLASACATKQERALDHFVTAYGADILRIAARACAPGVSVDDVRQILIERLVVGTAGTAPKIASYRGTGSLRSWVRAAAGRAMIDVFRASRRGREVSIEESILKSLDGGGNPELVYLKRHYGDLFGRAFEQAVAALPPRARNLLRHVFVDGLSVDQVAGVYGVHRTTAMRRLAAARDDLFRATREALRDRLGVSGDDVESIVRLLGSSFELSLERVFTTETVVGKRSPRR
jgi:RNA polymerase sigma-70 factor, ECF subfamily